MMCGPIFKDQFKFKIKLSRPYLGWSGSFQKHQGLDWPMKEN